MNGSRMTLGLAVGALCIAAWHVDRCWAADAAAMGPAEGMFVRLGRLVTLRDYNTRVVLAGTMLLGFSAGIVGVFTLLRKRTLVGDVVSHASLPGIAIAFLVLEVLQPGTGKWLPGLLLGALIAGLVGMATVKAVLGATRLKEDAALAIVLGTFFGGGVVLLTAIQNTASGNAAGLNHFILGKAAAMVVADMWTTGLIALIVAVVIGSLFKELTVLCFDPEYAAAQGWPVGRLDALLLLLVSIVTVVGLQSVGVLLVVGLLIIPATAARFWTDRIFRMTVLSGSIGAACAGLGVAVSSVVPHIAAGPMIVLCGTGAFAVSFFFGARRGLVVRWWTRWRTLQRVDRQHVLRALYELVENSCPAGVSFEAELTQRDIPWTDVLHHGHWKRIRLKRTLARMEREGLLTLGPAREIRLTSLGAHTACETVRRHRMWELYLIEYAAVPPANADRDADDVEHFVGPDVADRLAELLDQEGRLATMPASPHGATGREQKRGRDARNT